jgi:hypothetical protein
MKPLLLLAAVLNTAAAEPDTSGQQIETVPAGAVATTVLALAEQALSFCPAADGPVDVEALINAAERAGWPSFVTDERPDGAYARGLLKMGDIYRISRRVIVAEDGSDRGQVDLLLARIARIERMDGSVSLDWNGCSVRAAPRQAGQILNDTEMAVMTDRMADVAVADSAKLGVTPTAPRDETTLWTFYRADDGWQFVTPDTVGVGRFRTMRIFQMPAGLEFGIFNREDLSPENSVSSR